MPNQAAAAPPEQATARPANADVITAIRAHHAQLAEQLRERTSATLDAARGGDCDAQRIALHAWYRDELMPHIVAEERALYSAGTEIDATRLLVRAMLDEHKDLVARIAQLALTLDASDAATTAAAAHALFGSHLGKENDLLLPALDAAGIDLGAALDGMHEILGHAHDRDSGEHGANGGCGCGHDDAAPAVQVLAGPTLRPDGFDPTVRVVDTTGARDGDLDVRTLPHGQRHEIIFRRLDALADGESLVIVNDHDPKPLRYQASAMWPDRFAWTYLESGPAVWRLEITRAG